jgi:hypothetical protein
MWAAAGEAEAVAVLECPAFGIDGEHHVALEHEAGFLAVMRIEFVTSASAGLHWAALALAGDNAAWRGVGVLLGAEKTCDTHAHDISESRQHP